MDKKGVIKQRVSEWKSYTTISVELWADDVLFILSKLEAAEKGLEQIKQFIDDERYTNAWKEACRTIDILKEV